MGEFTSEWLGTTGACAFLGITLRTLYRLIDGDEIAAYKMGRVIRVRRRDLDDYLDRSRVQPGTLRHLYPSAERDLEHWDETDDDIGDEEGE